VALKDSTAGPAGTQQHEYPGPKLASSEPHVPAPPADGMNPAPRLRERVPADTLAAMTASLPLFARSRGLRALGLLAWLALVVSSLAGPPLSSGSAHAQAMHATPTAAGEQAHRAASTHALHDGCDRHGGCCADAGGDGCPCIGMCAGTLPSAPSMLAVVPMPYAAHARLPRQRAPAMPAAPPLRPPSA
jgi:hypothetical protein